LNGDSDKAVVGRLSGDPDDPVVRRKFDRVMQEIGHDLMELFGVRFDQGQCRWKLDFETQLFSGGKRV
jgi:hypothetical protein